MESDDLPPGGGKRRRAGVETGIKDDGRHERRDNVGVEIVFDHHPHHPATILCPVSPSDGVGTDGKSREVVAGEEDVFRWKRREGVFAQPLGLSVGFLSR